jgi:hypothetical protein
MGFCLPGSTCSGQDLFLPSCWSLSLCVQARFIPNVGDTRFIKTPKSLLVYTNSLKKHLKFMNSTETSPCYTIIEIDHFNPQVGMTLREAIMHIFSAKKPDCTRLLYSSLQFLRGCVGPFCRSHCQDERSTQLETHTG